MEQQQLWVEPVGSIIIARIRGVPTEAILRECQQRVVTLIKDMRHGKMLYDALEMEAPTVELVLMQQKLEEGFGPMLEEGLGPMHLRRAIVVPNSRIAYLSRIAFGEGDYRVFYNDITAAVKWLEE